MNFNGKWQVFTENQRHTARRIIAWSKGAVEKPMIG